MHLQCTHAHIFICCTKTKMQRMSRTRTSHSYSNLLTSKVLVTSNNYPYGTNTHIECMYKSASIKLDHCKAIVLARH